MTKIFSNNKKKISASVILAVIIFTIAYHTKDNSRAQEAPEAKKIVAVSVQKAGDSKSATSLIRYPATVSGDQEVKIIATTGGIATAVSFDLGDQVGAGKMLVKIDDQNTSTGESGFRSGTIQQLEKAVEIADESYDLAKDNYKKDKNDATKSAKDIAKLQLENARIALESAVSGRLVKAPISGIIINRNVTTGDSVTLGQLLATISRTNKVRIQFFVDKAELANVKLGDDISVDNGENEVSAKIINISPQADATTKRFLVEAIPASSDSFIFGTVVNVGINIRKTTNGNGNLILPLSAVNITQNESYIFILENNAAKKVPVEILNVSGETAEVKADLSPDAMIIIEGNKLVSDGEKVEVKK